ncbi:hypothetical protein [uncultured Pseudodesulfovibrio sp.]|uniref:hypothetical protein n=1 Tax=uncultured Pseudodesulfovibrio sp. TaxID=2035858 RepID=UPI003749B10E
MAVPTGDLTGPDVQTLRKQSRDGTYVLIRYRLEQGVGDGWTIRGNALFQGVGRISQVQIRLNLVNGDDVIATVPLRVRVTPADKKVHFYGEFKTQALFETVDFGWRLKYRY